MFGLMPRRRVRTTGGVPARREYAPLDLLRREFASLFDRLFPEELTDYPWGFETEEREGEMVVRVEVPGFEPNELEVSLRGNALTVRAEHTEPAEGRGGERRHARLERTMTLPPGADPEKIEARYRNGVLEVHVPLGPEAKPRYIEVKA
jgi:HSP20 family protein